MEDDDTSARTGYSAYSKTPNTARSSSRDRFRPVTPISESSEPVGHAPRSFHQARILSSLAQPQPHLAHAIAPHIPTRSLFAAASTLALSSSTPARRSQKSVPRGSSMPSNDEHTLTDKRLKCSADRSEHTESRAAASPVELGFPANEDANSGQKSRLASSSRTGSKDIQPSVGQSVGETLCLEQRQLSRPAGEPSIRLADDFADSACAPITPHSHGIREPQTLLPTRYIARPTSRQSQRSSGTSPNASSYLDITCGQLDFKPPAAISDDEKSSPSGKNGPRFAHAEALDDQRPVAPVGQFMSLRTTRPSEKFAALRGRRPMHSRASEGSHQPPAATVSGKASLLSSRVISESQLRPSPATSPNHTPTSETFESRIPGPRRQQGSIMGNTPLQLTSRHPPASRLKAELDPSQPSEVLAPRKSSSASTSGASTLASSGDSSRTFVHDSTSLVVPAQSMDSLDKRTHLRLFATNPDALTSSSTESIGLVDVKMDPLVPPPRSFTPQSVPATPDPTRQIPETHRLTALMDGLGLTAEHPNQGSSIPTPLAATGRCEIEATEHAKLTCGSQRKPSHGFRRVSHEGLQPEWAPPAVENPPSSTETCTFHPFKRKQAKTDEFCRRQTHFSPIQSRGVSSVASGWKSPSISGIKSRTVKRITPFTGGALLDDFSFTIGDKLYGT
ncbi:hypothetical protein BKA62DRAFT_789180 [Auriculariales sp. MPI-PUGE-AT-0066]|nr:hypothetical protein BKA62DRAFT_789180 [Auriculariales sp. MPI-PUGE-AT-0066]